jgi:hypothetical protein
MACKSDNCNSKATYGFKFAVPEYCIIHGRQKGASTQYGICKCGLSAPRFASKGERASCCAKCKSADMINVADRKCKCEKHLPTYGMSTDKRPDYCSECKKDGMVNLKDKNKKCTCGKVIPSFGLPTDKRPSCCASCKKDGMINLTLDLCPCGKSAAFGFKGDKKPSYCLTCKKDEMENIVTKKCKCGKAIPSFGLKADKKATCCVNCKVDGMINVIAKVCKCGKSQPWYGLKTDKNATCCVKCKTEDMVDIVSKKCKCGSAQPSFGNKDDIKATCCAKCKDDTMENIKAKMCKCGKSQPYFGLITDKTASCCVNCKSDGMIDIYSKKCNGIIKYEDKGPMKCPYDSRAKKKYSYYCTKCFEYNFPDDPRTATIRSRTEETIVKSFLEEHYKEFIHNKALWTDQADCTCRRRIDFRTLIDNTLLCIEVDENQHKYYDENDKVTRYDELMLTQGAKMIFIRFNPHMYIDSDGRRKNPEMATRLIALKNEIDIQKRRIHDEENKELLEVFLLFFDE